MSDIFPKWTNKLPLQIILGAALVGTVGTLGVNYYFTNAVRGEKPPAGENPPRSQYKTKADVVAFVKKSFADGAAAIEARGDKGMSEIVVAPYSNEETRISDYAYGFIEHSGEHYGQLVVYYRLNGIVPPESRPRK